MPTPVRKTQVNLKPLLEKIGRGFVARMRQFVTQGKSLDFRRAEPLAPSTLAARRRRGNSSTTRLRDTGALMKNGFEIEAGPMLLQVGLSGAAHPNGKGASYNEIGAWNQASATPKPWNRDWFGVPEADVAPAIRKVATETERQLLDHPPFHQTRTTVVKL